MYNFMKRQRKFFMVMPFVLMIVLFSIIYQVYTTMKQTTLLELQSDFSWHSKKIKILIEQRILAYEHVLHSTKGLFIASDFVDRTEFKSYVKTLIFDKMFPGIQGVGYSMIVPAKKK